MNKLECGVYGLQTVLYLPSYLMFVLSREKLDWCGSLHYHNLISHYPELYAEHFILLQLKFLITA